MANLLEVIEVAYRQVFPNPTSNTPVTLEEFIVSGKLEYAVQTWLKSKTDKREEGYYDVPSYLLSEVELKVVDNCVDVSDLKPLTALGGDAWIINVGGFGCPCKYIKTTVNRYQLLHDDDSLSDDDRLYFHIGKKIAFPRGTHTDTLPFIYANDGSSVDEKRIEVDSVLAGIVRDKLVEKYLGKSNREDETQNENSNN